MGGPASLALADETATLAAGARLGAWLAQRPPARRTPLVVVLSGALGAGKTTFVRGALRAMGVTGTIRSPSYTLAEEYAAAGWELTHLDLYRLSPGEDLGELGLRDRLQGATVLMVEWPERARAGDLPPPDLSLALELGDGVHRLSGRAGTSQGQEMLTAILAASG